MICHLCGKTIGEHDLFPEYIKHVDKNNSSSIYHAKCYESLIKEPRYHDS